MPGTGLAKAQLTDGRLIDAELVLLAIGVRPEVGLARAAGLAIGSRGRIVVDASMCTSDPAIYAVGDLTEKPDRIDDGSALIPLANTANRQGRLVADAIVGRPVRLDRRLGTPIVRIFDLTVAVTGWNKNRLHPFPPRTPATTPTPNPWRPTAEHPSIPNSGGSPATRYRCCTASPTSPMSAATGCGGQRSPNPH